MSEAIRQGDIPGVQLRRRRRFAGVEAPELWRWLVEPAKLERWLAEEAQVEAGANGSLELRGDGGAERRREVAKTVSFEPPARWILAFRRDDWGAATRLELEISAGAGGAELSVLQVGFEKLPLSVGLTWWEAYRRRWTEALERLAAELARD